MSDSLVPPRPVRDLLAVAAIRAIGLLPHRGALALGSFLGRCAGLVLLRKRGTLRRNLEAAGVSDPDRACGRAARHAGRTIVEMAWLLSQTPERIDACTEVSNLDVLRDAVAEGRGVLLVSGHFGNWELGARVAGRVGVPVGVVARGLGSPRVERMISDFRAAAGVSTLIRAAPGSSVAALRTLCRGGVLACMMDRMSSGRRLAVPFLGRAMKVPLGPLVLALRAGCPIVFGVARRDRDGRMQINLERVDVTGLDRAEDVARVVGRRLEAAVRAAPEQWYWINRRTAQRPDRRALPPAPGSDAHPAATA